ncbi:unnamed protein product [Lasius platythorax]|uniref:Uncharacterized protein n=1 Tax=Lasius platythorax TaxID=488582 RepID=A0AAV2N4Y6_9HYME
MNIKSKDEIRDITARQPYRRRRTRDIIAKDLLSIHNHSVELRKCLDENFEDNVASQLLQPSSSQLVTKTPKILRKRAVQRIETIPKDEVLQQESISSVDSLQSINEQKQETSKEIAGRRLKRSAYKRAAALLELEELLLFYRHFSLISSSIVFLI